MASMPTRIVAGKGPLGKGGYAAPRKGKGAEPEYMLKRAEAYAVAHFDLVAGSFNLKEIAARAVDRAQRWIEKGIFDYDGMNDISPIEAFALSYKDGDMDGTILEWDNQDNDDDDSEEEAGFAGALVPAPPPVASEDEADIDTVSSLAEAKTMLKRKAQNTAEVLQQSAKMMKLLAQFAAEAAHSRSRIETLEATVRQMNHKLHSYGQQTHELGARMSANDAGIDPTTGEQTDPTFLPEDTDKKPPTNAQVRALGRAMKQAFNNAEVCNNMVKLLRLSDMPNEGTDPLTKRSDHKCFMRGQLAINLWLDVVPCLDLFWRLFSYLVHPHCESYRVLPEKGSIEMPFKYPNSVRSSTVMQTFNFIGDPDPHLASPSRIVSSSSSGELAVAHAPSRGGRSTSTSAPFGSMRLSSASPAGRAADPSPSPGFMRHPCEPVWAPEARHGPPMRRSKSANSTPGHPKARPPARPSQAPADAMDDDDDDDDEDVSESEMFGAQEEGGDEPSDSDDPEADERAMANAAARGTSSARAARRAAKEKNLQEAADMQAEEDAWAPGGASYMAAFSGDYSTSMTVEDADVRRAAQDAIPCAKGVVPNYTAGL